MRDPSEIDLNLLIVFQELLQQRQVSVVARRLGLSQPTISNALARLRRSFGDELSGQRQSMAAQADRNKFRAIVR